MAVITAIAATAWFAIPQLRGILLAYVAVNAVTRVAFGAHFPLDVIAGVALGYGSALAARSLLGAWVPSPALSGDARDGLSPVAAPVPAALPGPVGRTEQS
jgi:membrane-associated phospholipid phosphatase